MKKKIGLILKINYFLIGFRKNFLILTALIGINSLLEILSISIFIPALNLFVKNTNISIFSEFSFNQSLLIFFLLIVSIFLFKFLFFLYLMIFQNNFLKKINLHYNKELLFLLFKRPISFFLEKNSSENINLVKNVEAINLVLSNIILLIIDSLTSLLIIIFLLIYEPVITLVIILIIFLISISYYFYSKNIFSKIGEIRFKSSAKILNNLREIFNGIKEVKIYRAYNYFSNNFLINQTNFINSVNKERILVSLPKLFLEVVMILFFGIIFFIFLKFNYSFDEIIIKLSIFILVSLKLLPIVNRILLSIQGIKTHKFSFDQVFNNFFDERFNNLEIINKDKIEFQDKIEFKNVCFKYPGTSKKIFENLGISINKGDIIGIFGESGSGKSTFVDLVCGFQRPTSGFITLDGNKDNIYSSKWLDKISYIPQKIFLSDNSIKFNIAYGEQDKQHDLKKINFILNSEQLLSFSKNFPNQADTIIGEDGLKISGGQRQRIGIARAIYKQSDIIILDEATNALDSESEIHLLDFLFDYLKEKTIILISHKKENLRKCDKIFNLIDKKFEVI